MFKICFAYRQFVSFADSVTLFRRGSSGQSVRSAVRSNSTNPKKPWCHVVVTCEILSINLRISGGRLVGEVWRPKQDVPSQLFSI